MSTHSTTSALELSKSHRNETRRETMPAKLLEEYLHRLQMPGSDDRQVCSIVICRADP